MALNEQVRGASILEDLIGDSPWNAKQKLALGLICLMLVADGLDNLTMGVATPAVAKDLGVPLSAFGPVFALGLVGLSIGSLCAGTLGDRLGRKFVLLLSVFIFGTCTLASIWVSSVDQLSALRFCAGLGMGGAVPAATALIAELTPRRNRTFAISLGIIAIPVGAVVGSALAAQILPVLGWRWLFGIAAAFPLVLLPVFALLVPESPHFFLNSGRSREKIARSIALIGLTPPAEELAAPAGSAAAATPKAARPNPLALFRAGMGLDTIALCGAFFSSMSATYFMLSWLPAILSTAGLAIGASSHAMLVYNSGGIVAGLVSAEFVRRRGSRLLILVGFMGVAFSLLLAFGPAISTMGDALLLIVLAILGATITGLNNPLFAVAANRYPAEIRATGVGTVLFCGRIGSIITALAGGWLIALPNGAMVFFVTNAVILAISCVSLAVLRGHIPAARRRGDPEPART
ncbi:MAG TPA: MFS transporter [Allosphingosinicella sp.]|jgi:AAHS family 4-hydroxybenzoate transporter-like MFS transporter